MFNFAAENIDCHFSSDIRMKIRRCLFTITDIPWGQRYASLGWILFQHTSSTLDGSERRRNWGKKMDEVHRRDWSQRPNAFCLQRVNSSACPRHDLYPRNKRRERRLPKRDFRVIGRLHRRTIPWRGTRGRNGFSTASTRTTARFEAAAELSSAMPSAKDTSAFLLERRIPVLCRPYRQTRGHV